MLFGYILGVFHLLKAFFYMQMIRGRLCDDTKPETFNQLWTVEEQVMHTCSLFGLKDNLSC